MTKKRMHLFAMGCLALLGACNVSGQFQAELTPDWAGMTEIALAEISSANGPVVEVVQSIRCEPGGDASSIGPREEAGSTPPCPTESVGDVLREYAIRTGSVLVDGDSGAPACRWHDSESARPKGLRLEVMVHNVPNQEGQVLVWVRLECQQPGNVMGDPFRSSTVHLYGFVDGEWRRGEVVMIVM